MCCLWRLIRGCTIASQRPTGWGVYTSDPLTLRDSVVWVGAQTQVASIGTSSEQVDIDFCTIRGGILGFGSSSASVIYGPGNQQADPLFVDPANADYHLQPGSPCIDAGDPGYTAAPGETDVDGEARVQGAAIDMGADEVR